MTSTGLACASRKAPSFGYGDYLRFSKLMQERYGLHFPDSRRADLERGVRQAFAASTCADMNEYYRLLQNSESSEVHFERLANALTISETHFFRDAGQVDALYSHVLPQIISRRRALRTLRIWSAGCASGEEPYSIAMLLRELLPDVDEWSITILGTDINTEAIERARQAVYSEWAFREERAKQWRPRYFRRRGNHYELTSVIWRMVTFSPINLVEDNYPSYESNTTLMDLILCRNVMIYFTEPISRSIVDRFYNCLTYGGWLVVGHAEHSLTNYRRFQVYNFPNAILYQRTGQPQPPSQDWEWRAPPTEEGRLARIFPVSEGIAPPTEAEERRPHPIEPEPEPEPKPRPEMDHIYIHTLGRLGHVDPLERAKELLGYGRSEDARDLLMKMIGAGTNDASVYAFLGQACANLGDWEDAGSEIPYLMETLDPTGLFEVSGEQPSIFVQDSWRVRPNVSLQLGLRWDRSTYDNDVGQRVADLDMLQPRIGATWDITRNGRNLLRASWGRFMHPGLLRMPRLATVATATYDVWFSCSLPPEYGGLGLTDPADAAIYLVRFDDKAALIDAGCGQGHAGLKRHIAECLPSDVQLEYLLLTHCHFDHTGGAEAVRQEFGCSIVAHELDAVYLEAGDSDVTGASWYGARLEPLAIDVKLHGEQSTLTIGNGSVTAIHWPGHSPGSVVYTTQIGDELVLFGQDVHGPIHPALLSDESQYQASLAKLAALEADLLLEGHFGILWTKEEVREFIQSFMR